MAKDKEEVQPFEPIERTKECSAAELLLEDEQDPELELEKPSTELLEDYELPQEEPAPKINFMEMLNSPLTQSLIGGCKDLMKKEKPEPEPTDHLEVFVKGPSDAVLKFFDRG